MELDPGIKSVLEKHNQTHLVSFWNELDQAQQERLCQQLAKIDFDSIARLRNHKSETNDWAELSQLAKPPVAIRLGDESNLDKATGIGEQALRDGRVGFILVAGGQGTRLGFDLPKGMFPIGPISKRTLFEVIVDQLSARSEKFGSQIPFYLMTSPATHEATIEYFEKNDFLGYPPEAVRIFCQGTMPAVDQATGSVLLSDKSELFASPDGHGGMLQAFQESGALDSALQQGVDHLFYGQVDNPLLQVCDPALIGYHELHQSELTTQVVRKSFPLEKVGNVVSINGKMQIIEYSDLPDEVANKTDATGAPYLWAGNIAVHIFDARFLAKCATSPDCLPFHLAPKAVPYLNAYGELIQPSEPNAIKFEKFIFDLIPLAKKALAIEAAKSDAFAPVKNASGSPHDTPELAQQAISNLHRKWLESAGVSVKPDVQVEIHPRLALSPDDLLKKSGYPKEVTDSTFLQ